MTLEIQNTDPEVLEGDNQNIKELKDQVQFGELKKNVVEGEKNGIEIVDLIENGTDKEVYYVPVEDGKGNILKYKVMYIDKTNPSEILKLPVTDIDGKIIRFESFQRYIPMERPLVDPIDFVALGGGILKGFIGGLSKLAPKTGINLSKTAILKISKAQLFLNILGQEIPKELVGNVVAQGLQENN